MDTYSALRDAILKKRQVIANYKCYRREMCPHAIGTKKGRAHVLCYQFGGEGSRGLTPGGEWRCLEVDELENVSVREGPWHTSPNYSSWTQSCIDRVDVELHQ